MTQEEIAAELQKIRDERAARVKAMQEAEAARAAKDGAA